MTTPFVPMDPKLSPQILKFILSTPPMRISTPDHLCEAENNSSVLDSDPCSVISEELAMALINDASQVSKGDVEPMHSSKYNDNARQNSPKDAQMLPLTPPPSSHFPTVGSFHQMDNIFSDNAIPSSPCARDRVLPTGNETSAQRTKHHVTTPVSIMHPSQPYPIQPSNSQEGQYSPPRSGHAHHTDSLQQHRHGEMSYAALRNFRLVINQLTYPERLSHLTKESFLSPFLGIKSSVVMTELLPTYMTLFRTTLGPKHIES